MSLAHRSKNHDLQSLGRRAKKSLSLKSLRAHKPQVGQAVRPKAGQAVVEYVLLIAMVAGVVFAFKQTLFTPLVLNLEKISKEAGGAASQGGESRYGSYYSGSSTYGKK